jgi:hypothetical protein
MTEQNPFTTAPPSVENPFTIPPPIPLATPVPPVVPSPPTPPLNLFCTHCGNSVSEQAAVCKSCGAKPVGHKKFCRQCGVALNPEQVVCVKCGTEIGTGDFVATLMTGVKRVLPPNVSASIPEKINKLPKPVIIAGIVVVAVFCLMFLRSSVSPDNPSMVVKKFHVAIEKGDMKTVEKITTHEAAEFVALFGGMLKTYAQIHKIKNTSQTIKGNSAVVHVAYRNGGTDKYDLVKSGGKWKIQTPDISQSTRPPF